MDKDRIGGAVDKLKGSVKKGVGEATGDTSMEAEGHADKAKGSVQSGVGKAKDTLRDAVDGGNRT
jgi:uncharacterized protein YjbJ (UPF0337 family)